MAQALNKNRIRDSRRLVIITILAYLCSHGLPMADHFWGDIADYMGYFMVLSCVFGRLYCLLYIGGRKNETVIDQGPFSVVRNPLYLFSFIGAVGIALMSARVTLFLLVMGGYTFIYARLVLREEGFLREKFGADYDAYCARVPRFWPRLSQYQSPEALTIRPRFVLQGMADALPWLLAFPAFEVIEYFQAIHWLPSLFLLP